ncbi:hypothetical protein JNB_07394 [Janibacter sp. HTCC2649]|uniref:hypothetical protein n=1 Tax=Janibacter sp. HTCC2649 TaxID=313589 RepID=UPI0000670CBF|nr:hypothetical protein [Janibacter sp. HTCC2649]EAP99976.1 hypothetical protein JNB_07394 [Janibacter sp. HTCC2649]
MDITKSIATDYTVPFRTRERQGALPTLAPISVPVQGISVPAAGMAPSAVAGADFGANAAFDLITGDRSASFLASPL